MSIPSRIPEEALELAKRISRLTSESEPEAIIVSLRERLDRLEATRRRRTELEVLQATWRTLPVLEARFDENDLYGADGLPR